MSRHSPLRSLHRLPGYLAAGGRPPRPPWHRRQGTIGPSGLCKIISGTRLDRPVRVCVAGAGGFLGLAIVRALSAAGHEVRGLARSPDQAARIRSAGGIAAVGDLLEPSSLLGPLAGCELAVHVAQPSDGDLGRMRRVRVEGATNLIDASKRSGVRRILIGSGYWVYRSSPDLLVEESPLSPLSISKVNFDTEEVARSAALGGTVEAVVVRPGMVYGPGSWFAQMLDGIRKGTYRYVGDGASYLSPVDLEDAGEAFRVIAERWLPGQTFLVVDDRPVTTREFAEFVATSVGAPPPSGIAFTEAAKEWGPDLATLNAASRRASNARLRALGWRPRYPSYIEGIPELLHGSVPAHRPSPPT